MDPAARTIIIPALNVIIKFFPLPQPLTATRHGLRCHHIVEAEAQRIRSEVEEPISRRHSQLEEELQEYNSAMEIELQRVGERVQAFEAEVAQFFERILQGTDPASFATMASQLPVSSPFVDPDPGALVRDLRLSRSPAMQADSLSVPDQTPEEVQDHWWMDSPAALAARVRAKTGPGESG